MAPASKKGTGKAGARDRRSSSRHSTPMSALTDTTPGTPPAATPSNASQSAPALPTQTPYLHTPTAYLISPELDLGTLIEKSHPPSLKPHDPPTARELHALHDKIRDKLLKSLEKRGETCERNLRVVVQKRKESAQLEREREAAEQQVAADRIKKERDDGSGKTKKTGQKRSHAEAEGSDDRKSSVPSVGEHMLARQDGVGVHEGAAPPPSPPVEPGGMPADLMDTGGSPSESGDSDDDTQPALPLYKRAFGDDPSKVYDPTVYDIRPIVEGMTDAELRDIYNVAQWPESDLHDLTAGDPPDMDFSNAKPANQVNYSTFQTYLEPYIRPFSEEDVAFLKERGDRVTPYIIPQRGNRTYKEVWAAEDGLTGTEAPRKEEADPNVARGGMEDMNDEVAETDEISMGPVMNRLLSVIRPQPSATQNNRSGDDNAPDAQGDTTMSNTENADSQPQDTVPGASATEEHRPITALPNDAPRPTNLPPPDFDSFESRAIQELKYIGFLAPTDTPDFSQHLDDEVAARLRTLQAELRTVAARNNARKARILELTEERMAMQEYANIADDLDNQVNAAYLKRNRSLAKPSNKKGSSHAQRSGQKGVAAAVGGGGRGVSEGVKALMQKRKDWIEMVGPVVGFGRPAIPGDEETVFDEESMRRLERAEKEAEAGEGEGE